jgi:hypothetical protein
VRHARTVGVDACMKQQRHQAAGVTASFNMLRLRESPTCSKVDGPLVCNVRIGKPETLLFYPWYQLQWLRIVLLRLRGVNMFIKDFQQIRQRNRPGA